MQTEVILKLIIILGVFLSFSWGPQVVKAVFFSGNASSISVHLFAAGISMIVGGLLFL